MDNTQHKVIEIRKESISDFLSKFTTTEKNERGVPYCSVDAGLLPERLYIPKFTQIPAMWGSLSPGDIIKFHNDMRMHNVEGGKITHEIIYVLEKYDDYCNVAVKTSLRQPDTLIFKTQPE